MAMASTSPRGSRPLAEPGHSGMFVSGAVPMTTCATGCPLSSRIWVSNRSRTSRARCGSIGFVWTAPSLTLPRARGEAASCSARVGAAEPPALALPDKPSIAVLPFQNMSGDPEQEYFADGMVEEIITALSRIRWLFVIARNSSFTYKGQAIDVKQVGRELGVRYVLEGSVRKAAGRVRITAQLIDATNGAHLWADRFDWALEDVFELCRLHSVRAISVAGVIEPTLLAAEMARSAEGPTTDLTAYDLYLRAYALAFSWEKSATIRSLELLDQAIERDPRYGSALATAAAKRSFELRMWFGCTNDAGNEHRRGRGSNVASRLWPSASKSPASDDLNVLCRCRPTFSPTSATVGNRRRHVPYSIRAAKPQSEFCSRLAVERLVEGLGGEARAGDRAFRDLVAPQPTRAAS